MEVSLMEEESEVVVLAVQQNIDYRGSDDGGMVVGLALVLVPVMVVEHDC